MIRSVLPITAVASAVGLAILTSSISPSQARPLEFGILFGLIFFLLASLGALAFSLARSRSIVAIRRGVLVAIFLTGLLVLHRPLALLTPALAGLLAAIVGLTELFFLGAKLPRKTP